jgi:TDG/mug DNA glycosylase family protein
MTGVLPDVLKPGLHVVFCGTAVGPKSHEVGAYYAGPGNRFYTTLHECGLTDRRLKPEEFESLLDYGIGLTDLAKNIAALDNRLRQNAWDRKGLTEKIRACKPRVLAFNGKRAAREYFGRHVAYGRQQDTIDATVVFVLPSTSGAARRFWDIGRWNELAAFVEDQWEYALQGRRSPPD